MGRLGAVPAAFGIPWTLATARCRPSAWSCMMLSRLALTIVRCDAICRTCTEAYISAIPCRIVAKCPRQTGALRHDPLPDRGEVLRFGGGLLGLHCLQEKGPGEGEVVERCQLGG